MLKGVNKQIIEINDTGSDYFEKVLFFVKPAYQSVAQNKLETGAKSYMEELLATGIDRRGYLRKRQQKKRLQFWAAGFSIIGACMALIGLICILNQLSHLKFIQV